MWLDLWKFKWITGLTVFLVSYHWSGLIFSEVWNFPPSNYFIIYDISLSEWYLRICTARFPRCLARYEHQGHWCEGSFPPHSTVWCLFNVLFQRYCLPQSWQLYIVMETGLLLRCFIVGIIFIGIAWSQGCHFRIGEGHVIVTAKGNKYVKRKGNSCAWKWRSIQGDGNKSVPINYVKVMTRY